MSIAPAIAAFETAEAAGIGIVREGGVAPLPSYFSPGVAVEDLLEHFYRDWDADRVDWNGTAANAIDLADLSLRAPVRPTAKILCQAVNYAEHGAETKNAPPSRPFFFVRPLSSVVGCGQPILAHAQSDAVDFEIELAIVIGQPGRNIALSDARRHVGALMVGNDISYRDLQFNRGYEDLNQRFGRNWTHGKGLDGSCVLGPWLTLVTGEDVTLPRRLRCAVNGRVRQDDMSTSMVFDILTLVSAASQGMTLNRGDVILTGTPAGVGLADGDFLQAGDVVVSEIEGLGSVENVVVAVAPES